MINIHTDLLDLLIAEEYFVFCHILKRSNKENKSFPSRSTIQKETGLSREKLSSSIKSLVDKKLMTAEQVKTNGKFSKTVYTITTDLAGVYISSKGTKLTVEEDQETHRDTENRSTENRASENRDTENRPLSITQLEVLINRSITTSSEMEDGYRIDCLKITKAFYDIFTKHSFNVSEQVNGKGKGKVSSRLKNAKIEKWYDISKKTIEIDERTVDELKSLYYFFIDKNENTQRDFWLGTISSMDGIRKNFDKLLSDALKTTKKAEVKKPTYSGILSNVKK